MANQTAHRQKLMIFGLSLMALVLATLVTTSRAYRPPQNLPQIENKTQSFQVANLELNAAGDAYLLTLQNTSNKNINGYSIGTGPGSTVDVELTTAERIISPGETTQQRIPVSHLRGSNILDQPLNPITIRAVLFDDGTSDGDYKAVAPMKQRRFGAKLQLQRINGILESALATGEITPNTLARIEAQVSALTIEPSAGQPSMVKSGLQNAKDDVRSALNELKQRKTGLKEGLQDIKVKTTRIANSL